MNKMGEIYGVINIMTMPFNEEPETVSLELFPSFEKAMERSEQIIEEFVNDYGEEYIKYPTKDNPVAIMENGDVTGYVYIVETHAE